ncbi:hypothetical protein B0H14DRAFT_3453428 [Mycena olivaceomarginata]|nr:hypothetical protein B0H14DRAFT_3453428 [Mycena olivaceomarginata]
MSTENTCRRFDSSTKTVLVARLTFTSVAYGYRHHSAAQHTACARRKSAQSGRHHATVSRCLISALRHVDHTPTPNASASANPCSGTRCTPVLALRVGGRCADTISAQRGHTECAPCPLAMLTESHAVGVRLDDKHNKRYVRCVSSCMYKIRPGNVRLSISSTASLDVRCAPAQARNVFASLLAWLWIARHVPRPVGGLPREYVRRSRTDLESHPMLVFSQ